MINHYNPMIYPIKKWLKSFVMLGPAFEEGSLRLLGGEPGKCQGLNPPGVMAHDATVVARLGTGYGGDSQGDPKVMDGVLITVNNV